ncbi:MAG: hypothetical protein DWQ07_03055 [Chloroflexi bacterium]|nr:MAG: hypothetical protein DWQ07_03055 [Chloroflexota bacterium]MBL1193521.1 hypothetical protein [Chloroflexota bacterium]NOH10812.1 hypothetical protein [Chloroflexota bacterium]
MENREVITTENASQIEALHRLGFRRALELDISPDDSMLAVASSTGVQVYDLTTFEYLFGNNDNWSDSVDWSPDSSQLVSGHYDGSLNIWDVETQKVFTSKNMDERVWSTAWPPNGQGLASSSSMEMVIWEAGAFEKTQTVEGNFQNGIIWTEDSKNIVFHSGHAVRVVALDTGVTNGYQDADSQSFGGGSYIWFQFRRTCWSIQ